MACNRDCGHQPEKSIEHLEVNFVVMPKDANHYGNVHGGVILLQADNAAYGVASRYSRMNVVTAHISEVNFKTPVNVGDLVLVCADVVKVGRSSMDVRVCIHGEKLKTGEIFPVADAKFVMVAVGDDEKPKKIERPVE